MKKKFFIGIAMSLFAVATVFNMNIAEQGNAGDVSLDAIQVMSQAEAESNWGWGCRFDNIYGECRWTYMSLSACPSWAC